MSSFIPKTSFRVYKTNDARTLIEHPLRINANGSEPSQMLMITDSGISVAEKQTVFPTSQNAIIYTQEIMGVMGILQLSFGKYLLAITARKLAATIQSHKIWRITGGITIPIGAGAPVQVDKLDDKDLGKYALDLELLDSIKQIIQSGRLYYSNTYDLTHSIQHNYLQSLAKTATIVDDRYFFNTHLQEAIIQANQPENETTPWVTKLIAGFAGNVDMDSVLESSTQTYQVALISRINHRRLGTRYVRRGLDSEGNSVNNVEMEQIVFHHDFLKNKSISAFVQLRGSVPSVWGQDLDLSYRPRLILADINKEAVWSPIKTHLNDLKHQYIGDKAFSAGVDNGQVVCVNLLDDTGFEGPLTEIFENVVKRFGDPKLKYESFPMNKWCKKMNFTNMELLVDRVRLPMVNSGWFAAEGEVPTLHTKGSLRCSKIQTGVIRVNCLDSLDRTNLCCSYFARYMVPYQVQSISPGLPAVQVLPSTGVAPAEVRDPVALTRKSLDTGYTLLTCLWADSGDSLSLMYAGTGALKADVTRTGKRQLIAGSYADGMNSLTRYYLNNFTHGHLQDSYDLLTGRSTIHKVLELADLEGPIKAQRLKNPLFHRTKFPGSLIPTPVLNIVEPIYFNLREFLQQENAKPLQAKPTLINTVIVTMKDIAPARINGVIELIFALYLFFWIFLLTKLLNISGQNVVDQPRLSTEASHLKELAQ
ncbi:SacI homology domain-containing protein [Globomyces pollinis-pini]|nr:SacI homology domain-containing protein [Globomyces pollinis-pini]